MLRKAIIFGSLVDRISQKGFTGVGQSYCGLCAKIFCGGGNCFCRDRYAMLGSWRCWKQRKQLLDFSVYNEASFCDSFGDLWYGNFGWVSVVNNTSELSTFESDNGFTFILIWIFHVHTTLLFLCLLVMATKNCWVTWEILRKWGNEVHVDQL